MHLKLVVFTNHTFKIYILNWPRTRTHTFGAEVHNSNIRVKRWHNNQENSELDWKTQLLFKRFTYQVQRRELQSYKVEERAFGTPCNLSLCFKLAGFPMFAIFEDELEAKISLKALYSQNCNWMFFGTFFFFFGQKMSKILFKVR